MAGWKKCINCRWACDKNGENALTRKNGMISMSELNPNNYPTDDETAQNLSTLLDKMNQVRTAYGIPMVVTSGLRSEADQQRINPSAPKSMHLRGAACDILDKDGALLAWVLQNLPMMKSLGLHFEDFRWTSDWIHFQCLPPASGKLIFVPSSAPATAPDRWDGSYDHSLDD
jgi:hypothetical protein